MRGCRLAGLGRRGVRVDARVGAGVGLTIVDEGEFFFGLEDDLLIRLVIDGELDRAPHQGGLGNLVAGIGFDIEGRTQYADSDLIGVDHEAAVLIFCHVEISFPGQLDFPGICRKTLVVREPAIGIQPYLRAIG